MNRPATASASRHAFGESFTANMVTADWTADRGWGPLRLRPFGDLTISPAMAGLHYGQVVFEGLKAHRRVDGSIAAFRPDLHARRFQRSARRVAMPELPESMFLEAMEALVRTDGAELPDDDGLSFYLRPVLFASEQSLALRPAREYRFLLIAFVTTGFFGDRPEPVTVLVDREHVRAAPGGTGSAKFAGNYAAAFPAQLRAAEAGCHQVVWLDAVERQWVEELGAMNIFFVRRDGTGVELVTPELSGALLPGVTRDSVIRLAADAGHRVTEERVSVDQWRAECRSGRMTEVFACGTAAVISPVGEVRDGTGGWLVGDGTAGPVTLALRDALVAVHRGTAADTRGWMHPIH